jgi:hypothetical protein
MARIHNVIKSGIALSKEFKSIPFPVLIEASSKYKVLKLEPSGQDKELFSQIIESAKNFIQFAKRTKQRFQGDRPNDVGKRIEEVFVQELRKTKLIPKLLSKSGYPDMEILDQNGKIAYLESKAVSKGWNSTFRAFYYSNSKKITSDGRHLLIAWKIEEERDKYWKISGWKLCDLYHLKIKTKLEFNASNKDLYQSGLVLKEFNEL